MAEPAIEFRGLEELMQRMEAFPEKMNAAIQTTMEASLLTLQESVPPYPPVPEDSTYVRTGTLGRTLGASMTGGMGDGKPDIYEIRNVGAATEGRFGTRLEYAPYVIGDDTQSGRMGHWWTIKNVAERATDKVIRLWDSMADKIAAWLDGKGL